MNETTIDPSLSSVYLQNLSGSRVKRTKERERLRKDNPLTSFIQENGILFLIWDNVVEYKRRRVVELQSSDNRIYWQLLLRFCIVIPIIFCSTLYLMKADTSIGKIITVATVVFVIVAGILSLRLPRPRQPDPGARWTMGKLFPWRIESYDFVPQKLTLVMKRLDDCVPGLRFEMHTLRRERFFFVYNDERLEKFCIGYYKGD